MSDAIRKTLKMLSGGLRQVTQVLNERVAPVISQHQKRLDYQEQDIQTLYEIHEMMTHVMVRAQLEGLFLEVDTQDEDEVKSVHSKLAKLQDEYLATLSVSSFLGRLGSPENTGDSE